ncbi:MAG: amino acid ABC transporter substrate-binding protein [Chloroflexi bacterium]|nr:MAG: amino acid ABC transporter substrate-binding protein [Chloroflexota bacterium]
MRRYAPFIIIGISLLTMACGSLGQLVNQAVPTPEVIIITATPQDSADQEVALQITETPVPVDVAPTSDTTAVTTAPDTASIGESTLVAVQSRGVLNCGVNADLPGFGFYDAVRKRWTGFDVDFCRVIAAAVLGDANKVEYIPVITSEGPNERFTAVRSKLVDVVIRNTTWTASRDGAGLIFGPTTFHDGQTFLVTKKSGITTLEDLRDKRICASAGTTSLINLRDDFAARGITFEAVEIAGDILFQSYLDGKCDAVTSDSSQLAVQRVNFPKPDDHIVLGDRISREPLGPVMAEGDDQWYDIVSWSVYATMYAEELRVDRSNVDEMLTTSKDPRVLRLLGAEGKIGSQFGLAPDFGYQIVSQVGNYGDIYNANLGPTTMFNIDRGPNKAWNLGGGGVLASPPFR